MPLSPTIVTSSRAIFSVQYVIWYRHGFSTGPKACKPARLFTKKACTKAGRPGFVESPVAGPQTIKAGPARPVSNTASPWKTAQQPAHVGICPLSSLWPSPLLSRAFSAGHSIGCSGGRDALASALLRLRLRTTSTCYPLSVRTAFGMLQSVHARTSVSRTWLPVTSRYSLGWVFCSQLCLSACSHSVCCICWPPT